MTNLIIMDGIDNSPAKLDSVTYLRRKPQICNLAIFLTPGKSGLKP